MLERQRKIASLEIQLADCQEKCSEAGKQNARFLEHQFSLEKIKGDNAAILFYTNFPSYEALRSFYCYLEPKLCSISTSLVSGICITWINLLNFELKGIFQFPNEELVRKNMPKEFAQYRTTQIILNCTELFIQ